MKTTETVFSEPSFSNVAFWGLYEGKMKSDVSQFWENRFGSFHFYTIPHTQFFKIPLVELIRALFVKKSIFRMFQWKTMSNENHAVENFFSCGLFYIDIRAITFGFGENSLSRKVFQKLSLNFLFWKHERKHQLQSLLVGFSLTKMKIQLVEKLPRLFIFNDLFTDWNYLALFSHSICFKKEFRGGSFSWNIPNIWIWILT